MIFKVKLASNLRSYKLNFHKSKTLIYRHGFLADFSGFHL